MNRLCDKTIDEYGRYGFDGRTWDGSEFIKEGKNKDIYAGGLSTSYKVLIGIIAVASVVVLVANIIQMIS